MRAAPRSITLGLSLCPEDFHFTAVVTFSPTIAMGQNDSSEGQQCPSDAEGWSPAQISHALRDLARGEQTANALENSLSKLESKLDELLASFEESLEEVAMTKDSGTPDANNAGQSHDSNAKDSEKKTD
ncbi:hypothetical protein NKR19_g2321 [Coniochaeta hoffmannii]|uniref:Uncharacterized protein n=1 Tax=Coniochaeta hoffmannii TaxID=91930 RepID=A0AA38SAT5_9PEZI|nr:hypothetical protein NKR19_g2321 [Coniochaeta hoffmannii]